MTRDLSLAISLIAMALGAIACSSGDNGPPTGPQPPAAITFSGVVQTIFNQSCATSQCHAGASPQENMNLSQGQAYANIVNVPSQQVAGLLRVDPERPDSSYLILKLEGNAGAVGGMATQMPLGGALAQAQIDSIRSWITNGAPNN